MPFTSNTISAKNITAGAFQLSSELVDKISWYEPLTEVSKQNISDENIRSKTETYNRGFLYHLGNNPLESVNVGDTRITFDTVASGPITVIAEQYENTLTTYQADAGGTILLLKKGTFTKEEMYKEANQENRAVTWLLRFVGFFVMGFGLYLVLRPIEVFADVIPCAGSIIGCGLYCVAFTVAGFLSGLVIAISWLIHHPIIGLIILGVTGLLTALIAFLVQKRQKQANEKWHEDNTPNDLELGPDQKNETEIIMEDEPGIYVVPEAEVIYVPNAEAEIDTSKPL
jgi:hypothetical protein